ncbi:hypothetical protein [Aerosakkonema funiforme]|uniref:hypothetical protein n=1 Tax=Aerosakkonema funiforme TaxID=1246630 RepID=UPI0035B788D6
MKWPAWIPYPGAWMNAFVLYVLLRFISSGSKLFGDLGSFLGRFLQRPEHWVLSAVLAALAPILIIAFVHHWLYLFLDRFFPSIRSPEIGATRGFFPGLLSFWEGLYGWLVIAISTLISIGILALFYPFFNPKYYDYLLYHWNGFVYGPAMVVWTIIAAYLYQFEHLVQRRMMAVEFAENSDKRAG